MRYGLEPGYTLLNWVSGQLNIGVYGVNLFCGIVFTYGLILFCKSQPYPWISLGIAMPFLGIIFAMGATRQAAALGLFFIAIVLFDKVDFPSPNKAIEKIIPNENLKIIK